MDTAQVMTSNIRKIILYVFCAIFFAMVTFDFYRIMSFIKQGARFTADDGQELCLRIQALETDPRPCKYNINK